MSTCSPPEMVLQLGSMLEARLSLPGHVAECGVWQGGTARAMAERMVGSGKELHLFDTFCGMPDVEPDVDGHRKGDFGDTSVDVVRAAMGEFMDVTRIHPGVFPETFSSVSDLQFCLVHVDCDLYRSTRAAFEFFWRRLVPGGVILCQDYFSPATLGAKRAVDEFACARGRPVETDEMGWAFLTKNVSIESPQS